MKIILFISIVFLQGCSRTYENQKVYDISQGDSCTIYFSANSCCFYCISEEEKLRYVKRTNTVTIDPGPKGCDGCNGQFGYVFKGIKAGTDTVRIKEVPATTSCEEGIEAEIYIVHVE